MIPKTTRSILSVLLAALLLVTSTPLTPAFAGEGGAVSLQSESGESEGLTGSGTKDNPYQIGSAAELRKFAELVNGGETDANTRAELTADINLNPNMEIDEDGTVTNGNELYRWIPIGTSSNSYRGIFDGNGHTISGLFGYVSGTVQNLSVSDSVSVSDGEDVGGIVGYNVSGTVTNCAFSGSVTSSSSYVGGIVGSNNNGSVENCYNTGTVTSSGSPVGGVVGDNGNGSVENCYNTGTVTSSGSPVGGVVGWNRSSVTNCYFLQGTAESGIGVNDGSGDATATEKDDTAFHSGEVAWLLENGQTEDQTTPRTISTQTNPGQR